MAIRCIAVPILATCLPLLAQPPAIGEGGRKDYSFEKEAALGKHLAAEMRRQTTPVESAVVQDYIDRLGQKIAANMPNAHAQFTFRAIAEDPCPAVHEPTALPGGYVFVPAALFLAAQDTAEFVGMLTHAMVHVAEHDGTRHATRGQATNSASIPLNFIGGWGGSCGDGVALPRGLLTTRRSYEREGDVLTIPIMARAGFDPYALVRYTERVQAPPSSTASGMPSTYSPRDQRIAIMRSAIAKLPATEQATSADEDFIAARDAVRRFVPPHRRTPPSLRRKTR